MCLEKSTTFTIPLDSFEEERIKRVYARNILDFKDLHEFKFFLKSISDKKVRDLGERNLKNVLKIKYKNISISKEAYVAHISRVAMLTLKIKPNYSLQSIVPALIHNIYETSNLSDKELLKSFSKEALNTVKILTVNRNKQHRDEYLNEYYENIYRQPEWVGLIKVLDKLDNMFTLCLNPDQMKRELYLLHIKKFIMPLVEKIIPEMVSYFKGLINDCEMVGYQNNYIQKNFKG